jgi:hypothetical protein
MTNNLTTYEAESRLRAIALNAVREAMLVYSRWDKPFTDDDAARVDNIFQILHLADRQTEYEHASLADEKPAAVVKETRKIADILGDLPSVITSAPVAASVLTEDTPVKVSLPKAALKAAE